jgi:hypothetical protein
MRKAALKTILEKQKPRVVNGVAGAEGDTKTGLEKRFTGNFS